MSRLDINPSAISSTPPGGLQTIAELPRFRGLEDPDWGLDVTPAVEDLFSRRHQGLMRTHDGGRSDDCVLAYRNADLKALSVHPALSNQPPEVDARPFYEAADRVPGFQRLMTNSIFTMRPPDHGPARQLISRQLTVKSLQRSASQVGELIDGILRDALGRERIDFKAQFTNRVVSGFWSIVLGITPEESRRMCGLATRVQASNLFAPTPERRHDINEASLELLELLTWLLRTQLSRGGRPVLDDLAAAFTGSGQLGPAISLEALFGVGLLEGLHSLSGVMCSVVHALIKSGRPLAAVRADPTLIPSAYHEGVRLHPAVALTRRYAIESFAYAGLLIPEGSLVTLVWLCGNRDPTVFPDPGTYELHRPSRPQTTFGGGHYICPGRNVVKVLSEAVLRALIRPEVTITSDGDVRWVAASALHEPEQMPVTITAG